MADKPHHKSHVATRMPESRPMRLKASNCKGLPRSGFRWPHPQRQRDGQAAGAAAAVADGRARDAALLVQPRQHLVHRLRVPLPDIQLHLRTVNEGSRPTLRFT